MKRRLFVAAAAALTVLACGRTQEQDSSAAASADTLTRRQRDSIASTLPLPGASRIRDAQTAVDRANARAQQHDTMR